MPSPLGEGQGNMPINTFIWERSNRHADQYGYRGEVLHPNTVFPLTSFKIIIFHMTWSHKQSFYQEAIKIKSRGIQTRRICDVRFCRQKRRALSHNRATR